MNTILGLAVVAALARALFVATRENKNRDLTIEHHPEQAELPWFVTGPSGILAHGATRQAALDTYWRMTWNRAGNDCEDCA